MICNAHPLMSCSVSNSKVIMFRSVVCVVAEKNLAFCWISSFRREVAYNCGRLSCYAASSGNFLPTFRDN
jgi:hypothetical protein